MFRPLLACGSEQGGDCLERLARHTAHPKSTKRKSCPEWNVPAELFIMALDPVYIAVRPSIPHGLGFDKGCAKLTSA